eukprot:TRINITY_DN18124_c0_g1_i1.p1 TRINITY_DN18124_c0_g1~~TRINITY_DN18124_c0_g1_i1.p1  ORF type:complete len:190 (+),score=43.87 TRINITY_DN18124_c0_g1_i1:158-727(+)
MGAAFRKMINVFGTFGDTEARIIMVGLDAAGKTTLLYKLKLNENVQTIPTVGFNVETVQHRNVSFTMWDVGGQDKIRGLWHHYYQGTNAVIFVVDSNDRSRIEEAKEELHRVLDAEPLRNASLLVMANKQDLPHAMPACEMADKLGLHQMKIRNWFIQGTCANTADGLHEGIDWLANAVRSYPKIASSG